MNQKKTINGSRIEQARKLEGYTQKQLAVKIGVNQFAIAQYEKGIATPNLMICSTSNPAARFETEVLPKVESYRAVLKST